MATIGIDLGNNSTLATVWQNEQVIYIPNGFGEFITPSVISIEENKEIMVGKLAQSRLATHPKQTCNNFKTYLGTAQEFTLGDEVFTPEELLSIVLIQIKEDAEKYLGEPVTNAVISVPCYFEHAQRKGLQKAAELAELTIDQIVTDMSAASVTYYDLMQVDDAPVNDTILLIDISSTTLSMSIVELNNTEIRTIASIWNHHLGGNGVNQQILNCYLNYYPDLKSSITPEEKEILLRMIEGGKCEMVRSAESTIYFEHKEKTYPFRLSFLNLQEICKPLLKQIPPMLKQLLKDAQLDNIDTLEALLVGGASHLPTVQSYISGLIKKHLVSIEPNKVISYGLGVLSHKNKVFSFVDVTPYTLGVHSKKHDLPLFQPILERNVALPTTNLSYFQETLAPDTTTLTFDVYRGESIHTAENQYMGSVIFPLPEYYVGKKEVAYNLQFTYTENHEIYVSLKCEQVDDIFTKQLVSYEKPLRLTPKISNTAHLSEESQIMLKKAKFLFFEEKDLCKRETLTRLYLAIYRDVDLPYSKEVIETWFQKNNNAEQNER